MAAGAIETVLVGVDGGDASATAAEYAVAVADRYDADLVALYVIDGAEYRAMATGDRDPGTLSAEGQAFLGEISDIAAIAGVTVQQASAYAFSAHRKTIHPGSVVLDAAEEFDADFVVLPREPVEGRPSGEGTLAKAAEYALQYASQPVLAV